MGVGPHDQGSVIIRSGAMGACVASRGSPFVWIDAYWGPGNSDKVVDVTGTYTSSLAPIAPCLPYIRRREQFPGRSGSWLGPLRGQCTAGCASNYRHESPCTLTRRHAATLYATVSASFTIEQEGLPRLTRASDETGQDIELWNGDSPHRRLQALRDRLTEKGTK